MDLCWSEQATEIDQGLRLRAYPVQVRDQHQTASGVECPQYEVAVLPAGIEYRADVGVIEFERDAE